MREGGDLFESSIWKQRRYLPPGDSNASAADSSPRLRARHGTMSRGNAAYVSRTSTTPLVRRGVHVHGKINRENKPSGRECPRILAPLCGSTNLSTRCVLRTPVDHRQSRKTPRCVSSTHIYLHQLRRVSLQVVRCVCVCGQSKLCRRRRPKNGCPRHSLPSWASTGLVVRRG